MQGTVTFPKQAPDLGEIIDAVAALHPGQTYEVDEAELLTTTRNKNATTRKMLSPDIVLTNVVNASRGWRHRRMYLNPDLTTFDAVIQFERIDAAKLKPNECTWVHPATRAAYDFCPSTQRFTRKEPATVTAETTPTTQPETEFGEAQTLDAVRASEDKIDALGEPDVEFAARYTLTVPPKSGDTTTSTLILNVRLSRDTACAPEMLVRNVRVWTSTAHNEPPPDYEQFALVWNSAEPYADLLRSLVEHAWSHHKIAAPSPTDYQRLHKAVTEASNAQLDANLKLDEAKKRHDYAMSVFRAFYPITPSWAVACARARGLAMGYGFAWIGQNRQTHEFHVIPGADENANERVSSVGELLATFTRLNTGAGSTAVIAEYVEF